MNIFVDENRTDRWKDIRRLTDRSSAFATPSFNLDNNVCFFFCLYFLFI